MDVEDEFAMTEEENLIPVTYDKDRANSDNQLIH